jgi:hypothetical protein
MELSSWVVLNKVDKTGESSRQRCDIYIHVGARLCKRFLWVTDREISAHRPCEVIHDVIYDAM